MAGNRSLHAANRAKQDEFYTQLPDIEKELKHYRKHFRGKTVYCNCDDPTISKFFRYFELNFAKLGLKRLITTCYKNQQPDLFSNHNMETAIGIEYVGNGTEPTIFQLKEDGDFRSRECIALLKQADIVVTNPPFSLFREYIAQLVEYDKKFLVIGNKNAISYKEIFPLIKGGKLWVGNTPMSQDLLFDVPKQYAQELLKTKKVGSAYKIVDGIVKGRSQSVWFTNLDHKKRHEDLILYKKYSPDEYPKYDNYDAINVNKTEHIPVDYAGEMGVPISFLDKHNPDQFDIVGSDYEIKQGLLPELVDKNWVGKLDRGYINGKRIYARIIIRNKRV